MSRVFIIRGLYLTLLLSWLILVRGHTKLLFLGLITQSFLVRFGSRLLRGNRWLSLCVLLLSLLAVSVVACKVAVLAKPFCVVDFVRVSASPSLFRAHTPVVVTRSPSKTPHCIVVAQIAISIVFIKAGVGLELAHVRPAERTEPSIHVVGLPAKTTKSGIQRISMHVQVCVFKVNTGSLRMVLQLEAVPMVISWSNRRGKCESFAIDLRNEWIIFYRDNNLSRLQLAYNHILRMIIDGFLSDWLN